MAWPACSAKPLTNAVVKNTFLEFISLPASRPAVVRRARTDSVLFGLSDSEDETCSNEATADCESGREIDVCSVASVDCADEYVETPLPQCLGTPCFDVSFCTAVVNASAPAPFVGEALGQDVPIPTAQAWNVPECSQTGVDMAWVPSNSDYYSWYCGASYDDSCAWTTADGAVENEKFISLVSNFTDTVAASTSAGSSSRASSPSGPGRDGDEFMQKHQRAGLTHASVPRNVNLEQRFQCRDVSEELTTVMIRNVPNRYDQNLLMYELDELGFEGKYDFVHLPIDSSTNWNVGYAFVNFDSSSHAIECMSRLEGHYFLYYRSGKRRIAQVSTAHIQGLARNVAHYSKTSVGSGKMNPCFGPWLREWPDAKELDELDLTWHRGYCGQMHGQ